MKNKDTEINLGSGNNMEMKSSRMVTTYQVLYLTTPEDGTIPMTIKIEADFDTIPEEYQEVFMNMIPDELIGNLGDVHLYSNHIEQAKEQINREPFQLPKLTLEHSSLDPVELVYKLEGYQSHPTIKAPLSN